ncbi:MAG: SUMF1/EgtB/PvdO family nonheme iron enzyme [Saprospiraceae bacterium]|nr:SUMF1/EgtB/PvdO family nonheme iron enzyme [Saprospiraceae bacterium]
MRNISIQFFLISILSLSFSIASTANNLQITNVSYEEEDNALNFDISWDNAFYINGSWSDHIYIFAKYKNANSSTWERVMFEQNGHSDNSSSVNFRDATNSFFEDGKRFAVYAGNVATFTSGSQSANCTAILADNIEFFHPSFKVFGIEMIEISEIGEDYYCGDGISINRFHRGDDTTQAFFWLQDAVGSANIGNGANDINTTHPSGIPVATINQHIFRPTNNIMKYEISQKQYVEFLNTLNRTAQNNRVATDISGTTVTDVYVFTETAVVDPGARNGIRCEANLSNGGPIAFYCDLNGNGIPNEYDDGQNIAMTHLSGSDLFAYLDWAGLEPLNELEYEFICRGSFSPVPNEYAWGTSGYTSVTIDSGPTYGSADEELNEVIPIGPLRTASSPMRCGAAAKSFTNRISSGASAFGLMELSGNAAEIVIALLSESSFNTVVQAPNGKLDMFGNTDEPWPQEVITKGGFIESLGVNFSVSRRKTNANPFDERSPYAGGRGGY